MNKTVHVDELPFAPTEAPQDIKPRVFKPKLAPPLAQAADPDAFDWADDDAVVLREQRATAVYRNNEGEVIIRQRCWPDEDAFVFLSPELATTFMEGMAKRVRAS